MTWTTTLVYQTTSSRILENNRQGPTTSLTKPCLKKIRWAPNRFFQMTRAFSKEAKVWTNLKPISLPQRIKNYRTPVEPVIDALKHELKHDDWQLLTTKPKAFAQFHQQKAWGRTNRQWKRSTHETPEWTKRFFSYRHQADSQTDGRYLKIQKDYPGHI